MTGGSPSPSPSLTLSLFSPALSSPIAAMSRSFSFPTSTLSLDPSRLLLSNPLEQSPTNLGAYSLALARSSRTLPHVGGHAHAFEDQRGHLRKDSGSSATTTFTTTTTMSSSDDDQAREDGKKFQCALSLCSLPARLTLDFQVSDVSVAVPSKWTSRG